MKKFKLFLKIIGGIFATVLTLAYLAFLLVLPQFDINQYKAEVQKIAKEQANLDVDFFDAKIITTPLLGVGAKIDGFSIKLPDGSILFSADSAKARISLPSLLFMTVKVSCAEVETPFVNLEILNDKNFKITLLIEEILNKNSHIIEETKQEVVTEVDNGFQFDPSWIRIKVPCVKLTNYKVLINDLKSKHYLTLKGDEIRLGYDNGKFLTFKADAGFYSDENKNISANIDINTFLPKFEPTELDAEDDKAQKIELPFINPVTVYRNYDLKSNLDVKLKVREKNGTILSWGHANVDNTTLKLSHLQLPEGYLHLTTKRDNLDIDTDINFLDNQSIKVLGLANYGKKPKMDLLIQSNELYFNNIVILAKAILDSLHIRNDLNKVQMAGYFKSDAYIKTDFKTMVSNGGITIKDGALNIRGIGNIMSDLKSEIALEDNILNIKDTSLKLAGARVWAEGKIDENSVADIDIKTERINLPMLYNAFAPASLKRDIRFNSGNFAIDLKVLGKIEDIAAKLNVDLANLNIADRARTFVITNNNFKADFKCDKTDIVGNLANDNLKISLPATRSTLSVPKFALNIAQNNVEIPQNSAYINNSKFNFQGKILDYIKLADVNLNINGNLVGDDLMKLIGREFSQFINYKGQPSVNISITGDSKKQTLDAEIVSNKDNYFTPINISSLAGKTTALRSTVDFKENRIKIKQTGLFTKNVVTDAEGNNKVNYEEILGIDGTIAGDTINLIKVTMPKSLNMNLQAFRNSNLDLNGKMFIYGKIVNPEIRGGFTASSVSIPDLMMTLSSGAINFHGHDLGLNIQNLLLNGSDFNINSSISLLPSPILNINNMNIRSRLIDADKLMAVSDAAMKFVPASPASSNATSSQAADLPVALHNGRFMANSLKSGAIVTGRTTSNFLLDNNVLYLNNLRTNVFDGQVNGNISMNLISTLLDIKLAGDNIDVQKALLQAAAMDNMLYGTAEFSTDIRLKGVTYEEQMKTLEGNVDFKVANGQFGPFGKLENLIIAENIRQNEFFASTLGQALNSLTQIDTTHFKEMIGHITLNNGIATLDPITSFGNALSLNIFGDMDILANKADMKVRARLTSTIANLLGPLNYINPINITNATGGMNAFTAKAFMLFCEAVPQEEMDAVPAFENGYIDNNSMKFQLVVRGDLAKPLTLIKSFKWLALASDIEKANEFVMMLPEGKDGADYVINAESIELAKQNLQKEAQKTIEEQKEKAKQMAKDAAEAKKKEAKAIAEQKKQEAIEAVEKKKIEVQKATEAKIEEQKKGKLGDFFRKAKETQETIEKIQSAIEVEKAKTVEINE